MKKIISNFFHLESNQKLNFLAISFSTTVNAE